MAELAFHDFLQSTFGVYRDTFVSYLLMANSQRYPELKQFDHARLESEIRERWDRYSVFERSISERIGAPSFTFYEGPPTANGRPGLHHMVSRTIKDTFCRYKTMKGYRVDRKAGWDTHGLPVEIEVEKALGLESRAQVQEFGIEQFNRACRESVMQYKDLWDKLTVQMGYWVDLENPYITFETEYIESVWWLIKQIYEKGLLYEGFKIQWYSPGSGTVLSSHEVGLGYKEIQDPSVYVRFKLLDESASFLAWTTTPWTLVSNAALAVGPDITYVRIRREDEQVGIEELILAKDLLGLVKDDYTVLETVTGRDLEGIRYRPLFDYFEGDPGTEQAWRVVTADFVSTGDGTGVVHIAPAFGADDYELGEREGFPVLNPITLEGKFTDKVPEVSGVWFKDADKTIARMLRDRGSLFRHETYLHNYPHDWRKGTPLISYPVSSWFIRTTQIKDRMVELNNQVNWQPPSIGSGRFGKWLENNVDWAISRNRFWGTPLPIWRSDKEGSDYFEVIGSIEELRQKCDVQVPDFDALDLHRPYVDSFTWEAPDGGTMRRIPDLIDVWFDSGAMPFAQWHYPFENKELFEDAFPGDFIAEGVDQTRGWFYTLHAIAALVRDDVAFKNCVVNGFLLDENGEKMSKTKGNVVEPFETIQSRGADPVRWYIMSNSPPWENLKWSDRGLSDTTRKFFGTVTNVYNFFATYANIDGFDPGDAGIPIEDRPEMDRWIISRVETTVGKVDAAFTDYNPTRAARAIEQFVDDLSNWYVRRNRRRFWKAGPGPEKTAAYQTIYECLDRLAYLAAPIIPFYADWLHRALTGCEPSESVHLGSFPESDVTLVDHELEYRVELARTVASTVLAIRNRVSINVRQPLQKIMVVTDARVDQRSLERIRDVVLDEVNVKHMEYVSSSSGLVEKSATPDFKVLGRRLGKMMKVVNQAVRAMTTTEIDSLEQSGKFELDLGANGSVTIKIGEVEITSHGIEGWQVEQVNGVTVALDTSLTGELKLEGLAREFTNRIQNLRKSAGFNVVDRISINYAASDYLTEALAEHGEWIRNETLASELERTGSPDGERIEQFEIGSERATVGVSRVG